jgi:hypothetical protein
MSDECKNSPVRLTPETPTENISSYVERFSPFILEFQQNTVSSTTLQLSESERNLLRVQTSEINKFITAKMINYNVLPGDTGVFSKDFPNLNDRLTQLPFITQAEVQSFIEQSRIYTIYSIGLSLIGNDTNILRQLDYFFSPINISQSTIGSFCTLVPNIFSKLRNLRTVFNDIIGFASDIKDVIDRIKEQGISGLITQLVEQLKRTVDNIIRTVKAEIAGIVRSFSSTINGADYLKKRNTKPIVNKFDKLKGNADSVTSDSFSDYLKKVVEGIVSNFVSLFDPNSFNLEELQFIILRLCSFAGSIEKFFTTFLNPMKDLQSNYSSISSLISRGNVSAITSVLNSGGSRLSISERLSSVNVLLGIQGREFKDLNNPIDYYTETPRYRAYNDTSIDYPDGVFPSYEEILAGVKNVRYTPGPQSAKGGRNGWELVQGDVKQKLFVLASRWDGQINISSAWRTFGAQHRHPTGRALDISIRDFNARRRFKTVARECGFIGFGLYPWGVHIDTVGGDWNSGG